MKAYVVYWVNGRWNYSKGITCKMEWDLETPQWVERGTTTDEDW